MTVSHALRGLFAVSAAFLATCLPGPGARAADDCGAPVGGVVVCDAANEASSYHDADGITYTTSDLTIQHPGDGTPTEFISSGGSGAFGDLTIFSSGPVLQTLVSDGVAPAGIAAQSDDGAIVIETTGNGTVRTESDSTPGILGASLGSGAAGAVTITAGADVSTTGDMSAGIVGTSAGGAVSVTSQAISTEGGDAHGIFANSGGVGTDGVVMVLANGAVSTLGDGASGIYAFSAGGAVSVTSQAISTEGAVANGIYANTGGSGADGAVTVLTNGAVSTLGGGAFGIYANSAGGAVSVTSQAISTEGLGAYGVLANSNGSGADGTVDVVANGAISTRGIGAFGIYADSAGGAVSVTSQTISTDRGYGIYANSGGSGTDGAVTVLAEGAVSTLMGGTFGIYANSAGGAVSVTSQAVSTGGGGAIGIYANSGGSGAGGVVTVLAQGAVATLGDGATGIYAESVGGAVGVTSQAVSTEGGGAEGIHAHSGGSGVDGVVTVLANGAISTLGDGAHGVYADSAGGAVSVTSQAVSTAGESANGINANSGGVGANGAVTVLALGAVSTLNDITVGIYANSNAGPVSVTSQAVSTAGNGTNGIFANSGGAGTDGAVTVLAQGAVTTLGDSSTAIYAFSAAGPVSVTSQAVSTEGPASAGIYAWNSAGPDGVMVVAKGTVSTLDDGSRGIYADSGGGPVSVASQAVSTEGGGATAIYANSGGSGAAGMVTVLAEGAVSTEGGSAEGIHAISAGGAVSVTSQAVSTLGAGAVGIVAISNGAGVDSTVTVLANGVVSALGTATTGIYAFSAGGAVSVTSQAVSTEGSSSAGIYAENLDGPDGVTVLASGPVSTLGFGSRGIYASSNQGPASINSQTVSTTGAFSDAITASSNTAAVDVTATSVLATGPNSKAVIAVSGSAAVTVDLDVAQGGGGTGVGVLFGSSMAGVASSLTLHGGGSLGALSDQAVVGQIGNEVVLLSGHAVGQMMFSDGDDALRILSGGRYDLRNFADTDGDGVRDTTGDALLDLGAGANDEVFVAGNGVLALGIAAGDDIGRIVGAESFINAGVVSLADQSVGASAPDAGDRLWTDGPYQGSGGLLRLDARLDAGGPGLQLTDRFLVDGNVTGETGVRVYNDLGQGAPTGSGNTAGISIVQVAGTAAADSFTLAKPLTAGAWEYEIVAFDPGSSDAGEKDALLGGGAFWDYRLQSSFFEGVYEYAAVMQGPGLLGQAALEGALNRPDAPPAIAAPHEDQNAALGAGDAQEAVRPTAGDGVATGAWLAAFGQGLDVSSGNNLTFGQDNYGLQAGYDLAGWRGVFGSDDSLVLGAFGTLAEGKVAFNNSASTVDISLYGGGAYAAYGDGGFRADLVAQILTGDADYVAPYPSVDSSIDLTTLGLGAGASWRFDLGRVFVTPGAELRYVHAWGEDFQDGSNVTIGLDDTDSLVARGRVKAGMGFDNVAPYLSVGVAHEFLGEASATASGLTFNSSVEGTAFEVGGGIAAWALASNLSINLDAGYRFGDEVEGFTVSGGFKLSW